MKVDSPNLSEENKANDTKTKEYDSWDPWDLCDALRRNDPKAWKYVCGHAANSLYWKKYSYCQRAQIIPQDLHDELVVAVVRRKVLDKYRGEAHLIRYLQRVLLDFIHGRFENVMKKELPMVSEINRDELLATVEDARCLDGEAMMTRRETHQRLQSCFQQLWSKNPMRAYVFLLRNQGDVSAKVTARLLGVSPENVDQIHKRAKEDLKNMLSEEEGK